MNLTYSVLNISFVLYLCGINSTSSTQPNCSRYPNGCCPGYSWDDETNNCTECADGFSGIACMRKCVYPSYGQKCEQICNCSNETCDFQTGCSGQNDTHCSTDKEIDTPSNTQSYLNVKVSSPSSRNATHYPSDKEIDTSISTHSHLSIVVLSLSSIAIFVLMSYGSWRLKKVLLNRRIQEPVPEENHYHTILDQNLCTETKFQ